MCLSVPVEIIEREPADSSPMPMGVVTAAGEQRTCCLAYVPEAVVGDFVLVQNGFAVSVLDKEDAAKSFDSFAELGVIEPGTAP